MNEKSHARGLREPQVRRRADDRRCEGNVRPGKLWDAKPAARTQGVGLMGRTLTVLSPPYVSDAVPRGRIALPRGAYARWLGAVPTIPPLRSPPSLLHQGVIHLLSTLCSPRPLPVIRDNPCPLSLTMLVAHYTLHLASQFSSLN
jgi:hypothetical protein